jgi:pantetheine-phosphate adenylyltransferase
MSTAVYALSADPITFGHLDIIARAAKLFDTLVVAIGINPKKNYTFSLAERTQLARESVKGFSNVRVESFEGLLVDFAYEIGASVLVRGVRNQKDFEFEKTLCWLGDGQKLGLETVLFITKPELTGISSSAVKELQSGQGLIHEYVPLVVKQNLEKVLSHQYLVGITGEIGVGKSFVADELVKLARETGQEAHNIELDALGHEILEELSEPKYQQLRVELIQKLGAEIADPDGKIIRKKLAEVVFGDPAKMQLLNDLMRSPLLVRLRKVIYGKKGLLFLNGAILAEAGWLPLVNNHVILVTADQATQQHRLEKRGLTAAQIDRRLASQAKAKNKLMAIQAAIEAAQFGQVWEVESTSALTAQLPSLLRKLQKQLE